MRQSWYTSNEGPRTPAHASPRRRRSRQANGKRILMRSLDTERLLRVHYSICLVKCRDVQRCYLLRTNLIACHSLKRATTSRRIRLFLISVRALANLFFMPAYRPTARARVLRWCLPVYSSLKTRSLSLSTSETRRKSWRANKLTMLHSPTSLLRGKTQLHNLPLIDWPHLSNHLRYSHHRN